jgi:hypothetical protein
LVFKKLGIVKKSKKLQNLGIRLTSQYDINSYLNIILFEYDLQKKMNF